MYVIRARFQAFWTAGKSYFNQLEELEQCIRDGLPRTDRWAQVSGFHYDCFGIFIRCRPYGPVPVSWNSFFQPPFARLLVDDLHIEFGSNVWHSTDENEVAICLALVRSIRQGFGRGILLDDQDG